MDALFAPTSVHNAKPHFPLFDTRVIVMEGRARGGAVVEGGMRREERVDVRM